MAKNETYQIVAICENCGHTPKEKAPDGTVIQPREYEIPKGISVLIFLGSQVCPICGLYGSLRRRP